MHESSIVILYKDSGSQKKENRDLISLHFAIPAPDAPAKVKPALPISYPGGSLEGYPGDLEQFWPGGLAI